MIIDSNSHSWFVWLIIIMFAWSAISLILVMIYMLYLEFRIWLLDFIIDLKYREIERIKNKKNET